MRNDGTGFAHALFEEICREDKIACRYKRRDFKARCVERGGITMAEVDLPEHETKLNNILRVYLLFVERGGEAWFRKYFLIKRFADGRAYILHVDEKGEGFLVEELTPFLGDREYEYWRLANSYAGMVLQI